MALPQEIVGQVIDYLHDDFDALKACALTQRSWQPTARSHLFRKVTFSSRKSLEKWSRRFPSTVASPSIYGRDMLLVRDFPVPPPAPPQLLEHWQSFKRVEHLRWCDARLLIFRGHSFEPYFGHMISSLRSLRLMCPQCTSNEFMEFLCMFPNLENLNLFVMPEVLQRSPERHVPKSSPKFTQRLVLAHPLSIIQSGVLEDLLHLPGGLNFRCLEFSQMGLRVDVDELISTCAPTLTELVIGVNLVDGKPEKGDPFVNIGKALKLQSLVIKFAEENPIDWISDVLATIKSPYISSITFQLESFYSLVRIVRVGVPEVKEDPHDKDKALVRICREVFPELTNIVVERIQR